MMSYMQRKEEDSEKKRNLNCQRLKHKVTIAKTERF